MIWRFLPFFNQFLIIFLSFCTNLEPDFSFILPLQQIINDWFSITFQFLFLYSNIWSWVYFFSLIIPSFLSFLSTVFHFMFIFSWYFINFWFLQSCNSKISLLLVGSKPVFLSSLTIQWIIPFPLPLLDLLVRLQVEEKWFLSVWPSNLEVCGEETSEGEG